jgi:gluconokinase
LHDLISFNLKHNEPGVLVCSALKELFRQQLMNDNEGVQLVYLKGSYDLIWSRMIARKEHYMKPYMLQSQFDILEEPTSLLSVDISKSVNDIIQEILKCLKKT